MDGGGLGWTKAGRDDIIGHVWMIRQRGTALMVRWKGEAVTVKWRGEAETVRRWAKIVIWGEIWMDREGRLSWSHRVGRDLHPSMYQLTVSSGIRGLWRVGAGF